MVQEHLIRVEYVSSNFPAIVSTTSTTKSTTTATNSAIEAYYNCPTLLALPPPRIPLGVQTSRRSIDRFRGGVPRKC